MKRLGLVLFGFFWRFLVLQSSSTLREYHPNESFSLPLRARNVRLRTRCFTFSNTNETEILCD